MVMKPTESYKRLRVSYIMLHYKHSMPTTCFGHSCGHLQGSALQRIY